MKKKERIELILNNFLEMQGFNDARAEYIEHSDSYYCNNQIVLGGMSDVTGDRIFLRYCKETLGLKIDLSIETLSFLHELGHHKTLEIVSDEEYIVSVAIKQMLYEQDIEDEERFIKYFTCPIEEAATIDAVNFCNDNSALVSKFDKDLLSALYGD